MSSAPSASKLTMGAGYFWAHTERRMPPSEPSIARCSCVLSHIRCANREAMCLELVIIVVRLRVGARWTLVQSPSMHWSNVTRNTPGSFITACTTDVFQELARAGCSKRKHDQHCVDTCNITWHAPNTACLLPILPQMSPSASF